MSLSAAGFVGLSIATSFVNHCSTYSGGSVGPDELFSWAPRVRHSHRSRQEVFSNAQSFGGRYCEDRAYREYLREQRLQYREFRALDRRDQEEYWRWRHAHPDREYREQRR